MFIDHTGQVISYRPVKTLNKTTSKCSFGQSCKKIGLALGKGVLKCDVCSWTSFMPMKHITYPPHLNMHINIHHIYSHACTHTHICCIGPSDKMRLRRGWSYETNWWSTWIKMMKLDFLEKSGRRHWSQRVSNGGLSEVAEMCSSHRTNWRIWRMPGNNACNIEAHQFCVRGRWRGEVEESTR